eukprot:3234316-Amphidinium_carterae.1
MIYYHLRRADGWFVVLPLSQSNLKPKQRPRANKHTYIIPGTRRTDLHTKVKGAHTLQARRLQQACDKASRTT